MLKDYKFQGWGYEELAEAFEILKDKDNPDDDNVVELLQTYITTNLLVPGPGSIEGKKIMSDACDIIRNYIKALLTYEGNYYGPVWKAMLEIEDDFTLLQITHDMIPNMWT